MKKVDKRRQIYRYFSCIPAIITMVVIFQFSAASGVESSGTSSSLLENIFNQIEKIFHIELQFQEKRRLLEVLETPLRKCAHMAEYMCLALTVILPFHVFGKSGKTLIFGSAAVSILYACTDELHQYFVPGRAGRIIDILIDSVGVWIGIGIGVIILSVVRKAKKQ